MQVAKSLANNIKISQIDIDVLKLPLLIPAILAGSYTGKTTFDLSVFRSPTYLLNEIRNRINENTPF